MTDVSKVASAVADEIERKGHWQEGVNDSDDGVCVVTSDAMWSDGYSAAADFKITLARRLGCTDMQYTHTITKWNDTTPTAEVLETLRSL